MPLRRSGKPRPRMTFSRRQVVGLGLAQAALGGCAGSLHMGRQAGPVYRDSGPPQIEIVVFEHVRLSLPFHTAAIISAPEARVLYDPGGWWGDAQGQRVNDVTHGLSHAREAAFLERDYFGARPGTWKLHQFNTELAPGEASHALRLARDMPPVAFGMCCWALTRLLVRLPAFADLGIWWWPAILLARLQLRNDLRQTTRLVPRQGLRTAPARPGTGRNRHTHAHDTNLSYLLGKRGQIVKGTSP